MSGFPIVDLVLGIIFFYFLLSLISSSILEIVLTVKRTRAKVLEEWLLQIFDTRVTNAKGQLVKFGKEIIDHCTVTALSSKTNSGPSYIDAKNFASALLDKIAGNANQQSFTNINDIITALNNTTVISADLKKSFLLYAHEASDTINTVTVKTTGPMEMFRSKLENWYDTNMDRITGTMKALYTRRFTMIIGIVVTLLLNADTVTITKYLYSNDDARARVAAKAYATGTDKNIQSAIDSLGTRLAANDTAKITSLKELQGAINEKVSSINTTHAALKESFPIGWNKPEFAGERKWYEWALFGIFKLVGLAVTVLAIMMGAPFWFDILNKIANLRGTGPKPASSTDNDFNKAK